MAAQGISRRSLIGAGALGALTLAGVRTASALGQGESRRLKKAKNIVQLVSDGMSMGVPSMAHQLMNLRDGSSAYWTWLAQQPYAVNALQDTRSLNSLVPDSAAASSAWGCGRRVWNGQLNAYPDGTLLRTLADLLKNEAKMKFGLVTTATMTHATPAGMSVAHMSRDDQEGIAVKYLQAEIDLLMGGGDMMFSGELRSDDRDLYADFARAGYTIARDRASALAAPSGRKLLGIFTRSHLPYTVDHEQSPELKASVPTLTEMAMKAIEVLDGSPEGFFLQVEGARVDHGAHANDIAATLLDHVAFDEATRAVVEWALEDGETLVVVTSDHGNANPGLVGGGDEFAGSTGGLRSLLGMKASYEAMRATLNREVTAQTLRETIRERLGVSLTADEAVHAATALRGENPVRVSEHEGFGSAVLSQVLSNHTKICWASGSHTSDYCLVTAIGPGAEDFAGVTDNHSWFDRFLAQRDIRWSNPTMSFEEARRKRSARAMREVDACYRSHWNV